ncbi:hypothetical protein PV328_003520 [Microctonus aethiopoides]|uniref:Uncharacterized protein n=1 Tax=Microctonus aethiopoides TaxID=144406 RepID=A0AA39F8L7_9HYME|nr:hypothetical protein PV328_003520 [Microctonus aethiopoides]
MKKFVIFGIFIATALAVPAPEVNNGNLDCLETDESFFSCLAVKANNAIVRAGRSNDFELIQGITFIRDTPMERSGKTLKTETDMLNELPREASDRIMKLISMIYESTVSFLKSHSLKINLPDQPLARALSEGRAKLKKFALPMMAAVALKLFALVPIVMGGLGLLVLKALVVGKIALLFAAILAFQRFAGGSGASSIGSIFNRTPQASYYDGTASQGWTSGVQQPQSGYYKRSFDDIKSAQNLAYSAHAPTESD